MQGFDHKLKHNFSGGTAIIYLFFRPYLFDMLKQLKEDYELVLFTAASKDYAKCIRSILEKEEQYFDLLLHR